MEIDLCEGSGCSAEADWTGSSYNQGILNMFAHDDYDAKKSYLFTNAARHVSVTKSRLV